MHHDFAGNAGGIGHHHVVADDAIVRDVAVGHEEAAIAEPCSAALARTAVHRDAFTQPVVVPDFGIGQAIRLELEVLRVAADHRVFGDAVARAHAGVALDHGMRGDLAIVAMTTSSSMTA